MILFLIISLNISFKKMGMHCMDEYGGYLSLELDHKKEYFEYPRENCLRLNSGRSAIIEAIRISEVNTVYVPYYTCKSVVDSIINEGVKIRFYNIDRFFRPISVNKLDKDELIIWTNYYGIFSDSHVNEIITKYKNVLLDNTQAFFQRPNFDAYNVYSCRKFFGVCDGSYLIGDKINPKSEIKQGFSSYRAGFLLDAIDKGTNSAYIKSLDNEKAIDNEGVRKMSVLTKKMLGAIDYEHVIRKRQENFTIIHNEFRNYNELELGVDLKQCVPMVYPLLIGNSNMVREKLIKNRIYVPQWWKWVNENDNSNEFEKRLANNLIPLPIDQRNSADDMQYLVNIVRRIINE